MLQHAKKVLRVSASNLRTHFTGSETRYAGAAGKTKQSESGTKSETYTG